MTTTFDPELFTEDCTSLSESERWNVLVNAPPGLGKEPGTVEPCENCGVLVCPAHIWSRGMPPEWKRDWWEPGLGRLHTPRRCRFLRDLQERRPVQWITRRGEPCWRDQMSALLYGGCRFCNSHRWKCRVGGAAGEDWFIVCHGCGALQRRFAVTVRVNRTAPDPEDRGG